MNNQENNNVPYFLTFLGGAALGAIAGILYAPDSGKNIRDSLSFRLDNSLDKLRASVEKLARSKHEPTNSAQEEGQKVITEVKEKAEQLLTDVEDLLAQMRLQK
ncbi:MAG: YtxH domain-containing protein [Cytophagales bacterium]|nr:MAG: YtxH domain-containing protein [Cytophagales bacterium]TAF60559.1 MAG: YtxH domain-containing protein [Cytophagales bacterium]